MRFAIYLYRDSTHALLHQEHYTKNQVLRKHKGTIAKLFIGLHDLQIITSYVAPIPHKGLWPLSRGQGVSRTFFDGKPKKTTKLARNAN